MLNLFKRLAINGIRWVLGTPWRQIICAHVFGPDIDFDLGEKVIFRYHTCAKCGRSECVD